jgi:hypothetical protein
MLFIVQIHLNIISNKSFNILSKMLKNRKFWILFIILFDPLILKKELSPAEIWDKRNGKEQQLIKK